MRKLPFKCPHCVTSVLLEPRREEISTPVANDPPYHVWYCTLASCPACSRPIVWLSGHFRRYKDDNKADEWIDVKPFLAYPESGRRTASSEVPAEIASDYEQASIVLEQSPMASAALSRRCLQNVLSAKGYTAKNLAAQVDDVLNETDPRKALPSGLYDTVDAIRNFGNFSAHPINDVTTLQVIEVEPEEAEWCLEILEQMFDHYYVAPARAKARKDELNKKLVKAKKPPAK